MSYAEANQNGQGNALGQGSSIKGRHLLGGKAVPPPKPVVVNSANADQSNSVAGAISGGSQPSASKGSTIFSVGDGNAENDGLVVSGNRKCKFAPNSILLSSAGSASIHVPLCMEN